MAALLLCCSWPAAAGVDDVWAASPATNDSAWAQANAAPVNPGHSGGGNVIRVQASQYGQKWVGALAICPAGKQLLSGGGSCTGAPNSWITLTAPSGDGWQISCDSEQYPWYTATAWAFCQ